MKARWFFVVILGAWACERPEAPAPHAHQHTTEAKVESPKAPVLPAYEFPPPALQALQAAMDAQEAIRDLLARDSLGGTGTHAQRLADLLHDAEAAVGDSHRLIRQAIAEARHAAEDFGKKDDIEAARLAYGEVNRFLVGLAAADPRLQANWQLFSCPMAKGFRKWFQRGRDMQNPYMGSVMLACGSSAYWQDDVAAEPARGISHEGHGHKGEDIAYHTCPMHPSVRQSTAGVCPICAMDLVPVTWEERESGTVLVDEVRRQKIGVRTTEVVRAPMRKTVRAAGNITYDEGRQRDINLKQGGWVVRQHVDKLGQPVKRGQTLFTLYSPELYAAQKEYLVAVRSQSASIRASTMLEAAKQRLRLWDIDNTQLDRIAQGGKPFDALPVASPISGFVIEKNIVEGASVAAGQTLYKIADLSRVWIDAEADELDLPLLRSGLSATVRVPSLPGRRISTEVSQIYPYLNRETRRAVVRLEVTNPDFSLRPEMYADVEIVVELGERLQVPVEAVIYAGPRTLVFVDIGEGRLRPQEVSLGVRSQHAYEVLHGLREGQRVVSSGNFLIAAESRLRSAADYWEGEPHVHQH